MKGKMEIDEKVIEELQNIVGTEYVSTAQSDLFIYSQDMTENEPYWPDCVVMPDSVKEVQEVLRLANKEKICVTPYSAGSSVGGLAIPLKGGIILDLGRMNRLIEFNEKDMYIIVEPGFTQGDLRRLFDKKYPHFFYSFANAPPSTSVTANALLIGFGYNHNMIGTNADNINGMEVVLPTGEVVKVGSCSMSPYWATLGPLPHLAGLFVGWQGTTGVVTKIGLQIWPRHPFAQLKTVITTGIRPTFMFLQKLGQKRIAESCMNVPFDMAQASGNAIEFLKKAKTKHPAPLMREERIAATYDRPPGPDMFGNMMTIEADTKEEMDAKLALLDVIIKDELKDTQYTEMPAQPTDLSDFPIRGSAERLGRMTWIGSMGPTSQWIPAEEKLLPLFDKYRLMRIISASPFRGGHYGAIRAVVGFNPKDPDEVDRTKKLIREALIVLLDTGFVPYKAPYWAVKEMMRRSDPNWVELLTRVKHMMDPNNIMNPGRYGDTMD